MLQPPPWMSVIYNTLIGSSHGAVTWSTVAASSGELSVGNTKSFPFDETYEIARDKVLREDNFSGITTPQRATSSWQC
jgi:hypothetical protein